VTVFDPENKLVAYSGAFTEGVREVVSQWGKIYIISSDGKVRNSLASFRKYVPGLMHSAAFEPSRETDSRKIGNVVSQVALHTGFEFSQNAEP
jgi:hypothetical protein